MKTCFNCFGELQEGATICPRCGCSADLRNEDKYPHAIPCGTLLMNGKYTIGRVLGQGGFGITYVGLQSHPRKIVAIKEYFPEMLASRESTCSVIPFNMNKSGDFVYWKSQFLAEAKTLSNFIGSPNIVRVFSYFEENGTAYFVMEYVRGENLKQYVEERGGRISWEETWKLLFPILDALSEVHFRKIIHRDIKPENIILTRNQRVKLIDFGAARYSYGEKSQSLDAVLTPGYAPPEQYFRRGRQGAWTDVYALAATIYFCITGMDPPASIERTFGDSLEKPSSLGVSIPEYAENALLKALALNTEDRFQTTYDFRNAILANMGPTGGGQGGNSDSPLNPDVIIFKETKKKAADGDPDAQYMLGYLYEMSKGTRKDEEEAVKWYRLAAKQGNVAARKRLKDLLPPEPPINPDASISGGNGGQTTFSTGNGSDGTHSQIDKKLLGLILIAAAAIFVFVIAVVNPFRAKVNSGSNGSETPTPEPAKEISRTSDEPIALTDTWEEIIAASRDGTYKERYRIGDTKELDMGTEGTITMMLVAIDEDDLADGSGKAPMTWVADELLQSEHCMNSNWTNEGGWEASEMRSWLREDILPLMPTTVVNSIREVTKFSYLYEEEKGIASTDTIWIPSSREVFLADKGEWVNEYREKEGAAYTKVLKDDESRVRSRDGASSVSWWWLRSAHYSRTTRYRSYLFELVDNNGSSFINDSPVEGGVVVGFCL